MNRPLLSGAVALGLLLVSTSLMAQDDVLAGYRKYYSGDTAGARDVLNRVLQSAPGHLPARFGLLHMLQDRVDEDPALQPSFERDLDLFLADAEKRYDRTSRDSEALFYLACPAALLVSTRWESI